MEMFYIFQIKNIKYNVKDLVGVSETSHTTHDTKDIVVSGVDTDLGSGGRADSCGGNNELKGCVINA